MRGALPDSTQVAIPSYHSFAEIELHDGGFKEMNNILWKDCRLEQPRCSAYSKYLVVRNIGHLIVDVAAWVPCEQYTAGFWAILAHGSAYWKDTYLLKTDDVIYWAVMPPVPSVYII